jgi:hypothetical protein
MTGEHLEGPIVVAIAAEVIILANLPTRRACKAVATL